MLKIDRTFVDGLSTDPNDRSIIRAVVGLTRAMGLRCLAEGVEREEQRAVLVALGCDLGQGYLWSRPLPEPEARRWVASRLLSG
jgi:EAL domain-containing protein (putative c-di-GMP-specific phosphodiesterase class I)